MLAIAALFVLPSSKVLYFTGAMKGLQLFQLSIIIFPICYCVKGTLYLLFPCHSDIYFNVLTIICMFTCFCT